MDYSNCMTGDWSSTHNGGLVQLDSGLVEIAYDDHQPLHIDAERANAFTHALAATVGLFGMYPMAAACWSKTWMECLTCLSFVVASIAVFAASALSHYLIHEPKLLSRLRSWDQGLIYLMIAGTYSPLAWKYIDEPWRSVLLSGMWIAAGTGLASKVVGMHRVNSMSLTTYLLLAWVPAAILFGFVPSGLVLWLLAGGSAYALGIIWLLNDRRFKYFHVLWHLNVMAGATISYLGIYLYIAAS